MNAYATKADLKEEFHFVKEEFRFVKEEFLHLKRFMVQLNLLTIAILGGLITALEFFG